MFIVGRLRGRDDTRLIIAAGFALTAFSLSQMTHFYLQMGTASVVWSGLTQGLGTGFVYVPLAAITFATLSSRFRNEGTAVFSLIRNVGSSVGISVVTTLFTRNSVDRIASGRAGDAVQRPASRAGAALSVGGSRPRCHRNGQAAMISATAAR
jgi:DHA2 family multidrug resistance protein